MMKQSIFKRVLSVILVFLLVASVLPPISNEAQAAAYTGIMRQTDSPWDTYWFNGGSLAGTGCGIFSLANAVGYLTGEKMDVVEIATWAHNNGMYNVTGADGTYRTSFYHRASERYGPTYGFTIDCDSDNSGYWSTASSSLLKNHLASGGTAVIHVYNHFMALVGYDPSNGMFHLYDCAPRDRRGTNYNGGDVWFSEAQLSSGYTDIDWFCLVSPTTKDEEAPVISDVIFSDVSTAGYTVSCKVTDNKNIKRVSFPTWTVYNNQDDLADQFFLTQQGTKDGDRYTFRVNASEHNYETGEYITHIYAEDWAGNRSCYELEAVEVRNDDQDPVISDVVYSELSSEGYTISCKVTDDWGVNSVAFPTWTVANGQDDLAAEFFTTQQGTRDGDRFTFRVNASDHNNESGYYATHIYATDCAGNRVCLPMEKVEVRNDTQSPVISDVKFSNITAEGYTVSCKVTDDWGVQTVSFPTWTNYNGQDDLAPKFMTTELGTKDGDTYTFEVKISDHNDEFGFYTTHIYAKDGAGNVVSVTPDSVEVKDPTQETALGQITLVSTSGYARDTSFVKQVRTQTSVESLLIEFENTDLEVVNRDGTAISGSSVVGTGTQINLYENGQVVDTVTIVILGDIDGNGRIDSTDYMRVKAAFLASFTLSDAEASAADVDGNGRIDSTDYMRIKGHFLGTYDLNG